MEQPGSRYGIVNTRVAVLGMAIALLAVPTNAAPAPRTAAQVAVSAPVSTQLPATGGETSATSRDSSESRNTVSVEPSSLILKSHGSPEAVDVMVKLRVPADQVVGPLSIQVPKDLISNMVVTPELKGDPVVSKSADGKATGEVQQRVRLTFDNVPQRLETTAIPLTVSFGRLLRSVDLSLTNVQNLPPGAALTLDVLRVAAWREGKPIQLNVRAVAADAPGITVTAGPFTDAQTNESLQLSFCVREEIEGQCVNNLTVPANTIRAVWLKPTSSSVSPGTYAGLISLLALNGLNASQSVSLTVTSDAWRYYGLGMLVLGTIVSFIITRYLPFQHGRDLALRPFLVLRWKLGLLGARLGTIDQSRCGSTMDRIRTIATSLDASTLEWEGLLSGVFPTPEGASGAALKEALATATAETTVIGQIADAILGASDPALQQQIDALAIDPAFPQANILDLIGSMRSGRVRSFAPTSRIISVTDQLNAITRRENHRNFLTWATSAVISVMVGYALVVALDNAFGGWTKLLTAFLWGLGVTSGGTKLTEVTAGTIQTILQPKAPA